MRRIVTRFIFGTALLLGFAIPASAQDVQAGGGLIHVNSSNFHLNFGAAYPLTTSGDLRVSGIGEFGLWFFEGNTFKWLGGGARVASTKNAKFQPFGQVLIGGVFLGGESEFTLMFGGGVDLPMNNNKYTLRIQADIPVIFEPNTNEVGFRLTGSIVFPFNR